MWREIGIWVLILIMILIFSQVWFHLVEGLLSKFKSFLDQNKYPTDAFIIYPDRKGYIGINAYEWLEDESLYIYLYQKEELEAFTAFFRNEFATQ